jgi:hypothetical protein
MYLGEKLLSRNDLAELVQGNDRSHLVTLQAFPALTLHISFFSFMTCHSIAQNHEDGSFTVVK